MGLHTDMPCVFGIERVNMQHNFKVGDRIKVVKLNPTGTPSEYNDFVGKTFEIVKVSGHGVSCNAPRGNVIFSMLFFYNEEIELVENRPVQEKQEVVPEQQQKNHAWAIVNKATGEVEWIRMTRRSARSMAALAKDTENNYKVKKIEYDFV